MSGLGHALVVGCGYLGSRIAGQLAAAGMAVTGINRSGLVPPGVEPLALDIFQPRKAALPAAEMIVYAVAPAGPAAAAYRQAYQ